MSQAAINIITVWSTVIVGCFTFIGVATTAYEIKERIKK